MKEKETQDRRRYYLSEFELYDGDHYITFNIVDINTDTDSITVAISNEGKISVCSFDLKSDGERYTKSSPRSPHSTGVFFEYGVMCNKIAVEDFEQAED